MSDVGTFLEQLGLGQFRAVFDENLIDDEVLADLTDTDLKELGLPLGARKKILKAIVADHHSTEPAASQQAERRQLTVMFIDLVGSTELSTRLDPEDMSALLRLYQNTVTGEITRFEGYVAKFMGDGVLAYFGWPRAHEDEAERAVRAALAMISSVARLEVAGESLACRIGIATGLVVVGNLIGEGAAQEETVVGETPNLAARLQSIAVPGQVVIAAATRRLLGADFELHDLGAQILKGIAESVSAFAVAGERAVESRFEARAGRSLPMVGRDQELALLLERWQMAKTGTGQTVLLVGEAGIGKSRIVHALLDALTGEPHARIRYQCSPYHRESALWPVIQQLTRAAGLTADADNNSKLDQLETTLNLAGSIEAAPLLGELIGLDVTRYGSPELSPQIKRARTLQALTTQLLGLASRQPVLVVLEDVHWIDPSTLELMQQCLDRTSDQNILMLITTRPDGQPPLAAHPHVTRLTLNRLGRSGVQAIVARLGGQALAPEVMDTIIARTDGVPLYVEELTKAILETGESAVPASLHDSLMARLDRLPEVKEVAQIAACIGREFEHRLLVSIAQLMEAALETALQGLIKAELIYRRAQPPDTAYQFKHALVRDAAYESLLKERRRNIHQQILTALENDPNVAPEVLAYHAEAAGLIDRAIELWEAASKAAIARPAFDEGITHLEHAIALITSRLESGNRVVLEHALSLQVQLSVALLARRGYQADVTRLAWEYALTLADRLGETPLRYSVLYGLWVGMYVRAEHAAALSQAEALVHLSEGSEDTAPLVVAHRLAGTSLCFQGRFLEGQNRLEQALVHYDPVAHKGLENRFGQDIGIALHCYMAFNLMLLGDTRRAWQYAREIEQALKHMNHANTFCYAHMHLAMFALLSRDGVAVESHIAKLAPFAREHNLGLWVDYSNLFHELKAIAQGDHADIECFMKVDAAVVSKKLQAFMPQLRIEAGWRALASGAHPQAGKLVSMTQEMIDETGETLMLADLHRLRGALAREAGDSESASTYLQQAIAFARNQGSKLWELRAAIDLAQLLHSDDRSREAEALLRPVVDSIPEGYCPEACDTARNLLNVFRAHH